MKKLKRLFCISLIAALLCNVPMLQAFAAANKYQYDSLDAIAEDVDVFRTLRSGAISVEKIKTTYYYKFTRSGYTPVFIKCSAMESTAAANSYLKDDNKALTKLLNEPDTGDRVCYYLTRSKEKGKNFDTYTSSRYRFELGVVGLEPTKITTTCKLTSSLKFVYTSKVRVGLGDSVRLATAKNTTERTKLLESYVTPANAWEYREALTRYDSAPEITPTVNLSIANTGENAVLLSQYKLTGKGIADTKINVNKLVNIGFKAASLAAKAKVSLGAAKSLYDVFNDINTLVKDKSERYNTGELITLSKKGNYVYTANYTSPIKLKESGDFLQVETYIGNKSQNVIGKGKAQFSLSFSFS